MLENGKINSAPTISCNPYAKLDPLSCLWIGALGYLIGYLQIDMLEWIGYNLLFPMVKCRE